MDLVYFVKTYDGADRISPRLMPLQCDPDAVQQQFPDWNSQLALLNIERMSLGSIAYTL
jgi:hypothetical protein